MSLASVNQEPLDYPRPARVRIVHLGLGAFARALPFWYTELVNRTLPAEQQWGIAAFTDRSTHLPTVLAQQDFRYTLIVPTMIASAAQDNTEQPPDQAPEQAPEQALSVESAEVVSALLAAHPGTDLDALSQYLRDPAVTVVTLSITEAGYHFSEDLGADPNASPETELASFALGRLTLALYERYRHSQGTQESMRLSVVSCDNLAENGQASAGVVLRASALLDAEFHTWLQANVAFVSTEVDRITPRLPEDQRTHALIEQARDQTGLPDAAPVLTEHFSEWNLQDAFAGPRPAWERAGAHVVADVHPYEARKLLLLNAAHSLLAYAGRLRGYSYVHEAFADTWIRAQVELLWQDAARAFELPPGQTQEYTRALTKRFADPGLAHELAQIAQDGEHKLAVRIVPVLARAYERGWSPSAHWLTVKAWAVFTDQEVPQSLARVWPGAPDDIQIPDIQIPEDPCRGGRES